MKTYASSRKLRRPMLLAFVLFAGLGSNAQQASSSSNPSPLGVVDPKLIDAEISRIVEQTIKDAIIRLPDGQTAYIRPFPSNENIEKVKHFGNQANDALSRYLDSSPKEQQVALRLLGAVGTEQSLDVVRTFAEKSQSPFIRSQALFDLAYSTRDKDILLIKKISTEDPDPQVRKQALELIKRNSNK
jgi:HEAT repeats